jgi:hypothetical protein
MELFQCNIHRVVLWVLCIRQNICTFLTFVCLTQFGCLIRVTCQYDSKDLWPQLELSGDWTMFIGHSCCLSDTLLIRHIAGILFTLLYYLNLIYLIATFQNISQQNIVISTNSHIMIPKRYKQPRYYGDILLQSYLAIARLVITRTSVFYTKSSPPSSFEQRQIISHSAKFSNILL